MSQESVSLFELNRLVKEKIVSSFPGLLWIVAEISSIQVNRAGHCYLELIERSEEKDEVIAKARGTIWSFTYRMIKPYFEEATGQTLKAGMKILFKASVEYHEIYGFSLNVKDINPDYTLGDIERKKRETIKRLEEEGVIDMNKEISFPPVPQRIAVISSPTAAGYQDFVHQLVNNQEGFKIYYHLFSAKVQGDYAPASIIAALDRIYEHEDLFDAVVLIRGGGSSFDLMCFDDYELTYNLAQFPLPVLTGIGHERDISVADMVAHTHLKTPTAVAEFLVRRINDFYFYLDGLQNAFTDIVTRNINDNKHKLELMAQKLVPVAGYNIEKQKRYLENLAGGIRRETTSFVNSRIQDLTHHYEVAGYLSTKMLKTKKQDIGFYFSKLKIETKGYFRSKDQYLHLKEETIKLYDPVNILNRGYSITYKGNKVIKQAEDVVSGEKIVTRLKNGEIISRVEKTKK